MATPRDSLTPLQLHGQDPENQWLPIYNRRTPYNEDEIVDLISAIVRDFTRLSYVDDQTDVVWPPEGGHVIEDALFDELNVSDAARSLIRRLPCDGGNAAGILLFGSSKLFRTTTDADLRWSRIILPGVSEELVLPRDVQLSSGDRESVRVFLDTEENTIRVVPNYEPADDVNPPNTPLERPEDPYYYRNYWACHAPSWLRMQLHRIKSLDAIPPGIWELSERYINSGNEWLRRKMKHILEGTYGWPDSFEQDAYDRDRERVWEEADREFEELGHPRVLQFP